MGFSLELHWAVERLLWAAAMAPGQSVLQGIVEGGGVAEGDRCERQVESETGEPAVKGESGFLGKDAPRGTFLGWWGGPLYHGWR